MRRDGGAIVIMSSTPPGVGLTSHEAQSSLEGLTRSAAATFAPHDIRINAVAPGLPRTTLEDSSASPDVDEARRDEPGDAVSVIGWLLDPAQSWVTGQVLGVECDLEHVQSN